MAIDSKSYLNWEGVKTLWGKIKSTFAKQATTLSGYGITDAYTKTEVDASIEEINDKMIEAIGVSELSTWLNDETTDADVTA